MTRVDLNWVFWFHVLLVLLAWTGPFLFSWYLLVPIYVLVLLQFIFFKRCFVNAGHALDESNDNTFYAHLLELLGFQPNRKQLKFFVRKIMYVLLSTFTLFWQLALNIEPLLF